MLKYTVLVISFLYKQKQEYAIVDIDATRYGVDTTQTHIHIQMEEKKAHQLSTNMKLTKKKNAWEKLKKQQSNRKNKLAPLSCRYRAD